MATGDDGILVLNNGSASMTVSVTGSTFTDNKGDHFQAATDADATSPMDISLGPPISWVRGRPVVYFCSLIETV